MTVTLGLRLTMLSDWHIGTGTAAHGHLDRLVARDRGLPYVPAKTLNGVWRDACEVAAFALDSGPAGVWHAWVEDLFGGQRGLTDRTVTGPSRPARMTYQGALRMPGRVAGLLADKPSLRQAATFAKPGVKIDAQRGTAQEDMLRVEEMARAGIELTGGVEIAGLDEERQSVALALLWAGARLLESLGAKRRRGSGRCRLELLPADLLPDDSRLTGDVPEPPEHRFRPVHAGPYAVPTGSGWVEAELVFRTRTPVLAHHCTQGNYVQGRDHLPGWLLLPAVLSRLGARAAALALRGDLVVTAATPGLPVPRVFAAAKGDKRRIVANNMKEEETNDKDKPKPCRDGYLDPERLPRLVLPKRVVRMHNTIDDASQRPTEEVGGVYVYSALAENIGLRARVRVRAGALPDGWPERLAGEWRVGRSAKDDYGRVAVTVRSVREITPDEPRPPNPLRVWLQSDLLVRDARLRPSAEAADVARALERAFAAAGTGTVRLRAVDGPGTAMAVDRVESWHRAWGLPRPTLIGLAAGSCLAFEVVEGTLTPEAVAEVEAAGVGERRAEGFGQVRINDPLLEQKFAGMEASTPEDESGKPEPPRPLHEGEPGHDTVRVFEKAAWRAEIYRACERFASDDECRGDLLPKGVTVTRLGALRRLLPDLGTPGRVAEWLDRLRDRWVVDKQQIGSLRRLFTDEGEVWRLLDPLRSDLVATDRGEIALRRELREEAVRALLNACLSVHARGEGAAEGTKGTDS